MHEHDCEKVLHDPEAFVTATENYVQHDGVKYALALSRLVFNELHLQVDTSVTAETKPLGKVVILSGSLARAQDLVQRDRGVANFVVVECVLIDSSNIELVLTGAHVEAEGLVINRVKALVVLGTLLVSLFQPHLDVRIALADPVLVPKIGSVVQFDVQPTLLGSHDADKIPTVNGVGNCGSHGGSGGEEGGDDGEELHVCVGCV